MTKTRQCVTLVFTLYVGVVYSLPGLANEEPMLVNPADLMAEFRQNALAMERKYVGRQIEASGVITFIGRDANGHPVVGLVSPINHLALNDPILARVETSHRGPEVTCKFKEDQIDELLKLKKSQQIITLCENLSIAGDSVSLDGCVFIRNL